MPDVPPKESVPSNAALLSTPVGFAKGVLGVSLYPWQAEVLSWTQDMHGRTKITVAAPNGSGKSERIIPCASLRWISCSNKGRVVITSKDGKQIDNQVMPGLDKNRGRFIDFGWKYRKITSPTGGSIVAFTTDEAGRFEGYHADIGEDSPLMIIVDEAKSVPEEIYKAIDRCTYNVLILISSTGLMQGRFYDSHHSLNGWLRKKVTVKETPHVPKERIDDIIATYGEDHPFTRSTLYSEFMSSDDDTSFFVTLSDIDNCMVSQPYLKQGDCVAFCDFAGGGDENVLAVRRGNKVEIVRAWREKDEMRACGQFVMHFRQQGLEASQIWGDNAGAGKPMIAYLNSIGWPINTFNAGERAQNDRDYANRGSEIWETAGRAVKRAEIILPEDPILHGQMTSRKRITDNIGRFMAEPKPEMRKRGVKSPDRADAVMGCIGLQPMKAWQSPDSMFQVGGFLESMDSIEEDELELIGSSAGD